ncbi:MAG: hypothetical protein NUV81_00240 [bacterium]|nr:hypothetical protein [bacterium]
MRKKILEKFATHRSFAEADVRQLVTDISLEMGFGLSRLDVPAQRHNRTPESISWLEDALVAEGERLLKLER